MPQKSPALTDAQSPSCGAFLSGQIHTGIWLRESVWFEEGLSAVRIKHPMGCVDARKVRQ